MEGFDFERLVFYELTLEFIRSVQPVIRGLPPGHGEFADQLRRASLSIALNIAEGAGEFSRKEKARFYRMARRSATECAAILDVMRCLEVAEEEGVAPGRLLLLRIIAMLVKTIRNLGADSPNSGTGTGTGTGTGREKRKG